MGVFSKNEQPTEKIKRSTYDRSWQNSLTMKYGYLYPCFCKETFSGCSWHIDAAAGLRFLPTFFPLQTKQRCSIDFFYVRSRNLWKGFKNFKFQTGKHDGLPRLSERNKMVHSKTGSLGDFLNLPSTIVGANTIKYSSDFFAPIYSPTNSSNTTFKLVSYSFTPARELINEPVGSENEGYRFITLKSISPSSGSFGSIAKSDISLFTPAGDGDLVDFNAYAAAYRKLPLSGPLPSAVLSGLKAGTLKFYGSTSVSLNGSSTVTVSDKSASGDPLFQLGKDGSVYILEPSRQYDLPYYSLFIGVLFGSIPNPPSSALYESLSQMPTLTVLVGDSEAFQIVEATSVLDSIPYEINALPFRAYEQIYNAFYRDDRNNPYVVNGEYDPNVFLPSYDGGIDDNTYELRKRNWEQDFLTTAMPSPQYGNAPLVGITEAGSLVFSDPNGDLFASKIQTDENGATVGFETTRSSSANKTLVSFVNSGISINDLRGVNSLQRYLEANIRRGLRYQDQIKSHYGVDVSYAELDMPEFLGSVNLSVNVDQINQTAPGDGDPLGAYAGQMSAIGGGKTINKYTDEDGFIIGLISVVPVPCYSQLLPKFFTKINDPLEYYSPEFAYLGMQPIKYDQVCPLQAANQGVSLDATYGYQRAWYEYMSDVDEIHGQFRTTLNNYVLSRVFNTVPSLNSDFLTVDPSQLNDVFSISEVEIDGKKVQLDTILGQVHFKVSFEAPIPRFGTPRLE